MKKSVILILLVLISSISLAELQPGKLWINNIEIPYPSEKIEKKTIEPKQISYVYANGQRIAKIEHNKGEDEVYYFHNDHLGSPRLITDSKGNVVEKIDYLPFGESFERNEKISYNSKELDKDTKLNYYGARYYNAPVGRFITADTVKGSIADPQSLNLYVYTKNNPMKFVDPDGRQVYVAGSNYNILQQYFDKEKYTLEYEEVNEEIFNPEEDKKLFKIKNIEREFESKTLTILRNLINQNKQKVQIVMTKLIEKGGGGFVAKEKVDFSHSVVLLSLTPSDTILPHELGHFLDYIHNSRRVLNAIAPAELINYQGADFETRLNYLKKTEQVAMYIENIYLKEYYENPKLREDYLQGMLPGERWPPKNLLEEKLFEPIE